MHRRKAVGSGGLQVQFNDEIETRVYENSQSGEQNAGSARKHQAAAARPPVCPEEGRERNGTGVLCCCANWQLTGTVIDYLCERMSC